MVLNPGANQYTCPAYSAKVCFMAAGDITTSVYKGRQARAMGGLLLLDVYGLTLFDRKKHLSSTYNSECVAEPDV